jgi:sulfide:quinone oxidoreductase
MAHILIIGGGFAGLVAAERLSESLDPDHQVTLVTPNERFTFYPALVQLAFGNCTADDITFDLSTKFKELGIRVIRGEMIRIDATAKTAEIAGEEFRGDIAYDYVVFAMGRRLATEKVPGFFEYASHLLGIGAATKFGEKIRDFHEGVILVGGCPGSRLPVPVCEAAFALAKKFEAEMRDGRVRVKVVFPDSLQAAFGGASLHKELEAAFERRGINVLYDVPIKEIRANQVVSSQGHNIDFDLLMLIPPFRGSAILNHLGITDDEDYIKVDAQMRVQGLDSAYAVGDVTALPGPKLAHMAVREADVAALNIAAELAGKEPATSYEHEIAAIIDAGSADSIFLHYGIWDEKLYRLKKGHVWGWAKELHDRLWRSKHS